MAEILIDWNAFRGRDLRNQRFARLTCLSVSSIRKRSHFSTRVYWNCLCDCGNRIEAETYKITSGHTGSCGCLQRERAAVAKTTHGFASRDKSKRHRLYTTWRGMIERCSNPESDSWIYYGLLGVTVCDRWKNFALFLQDVGPQWKAGLTLDRIDPFGNYEPTNFRWATAREQRMNQRKSRLNRNA